MIIGKKKLDIIRDVFFIVNIIGEYYLFKVIMF